MTASKIALVTGLGVATILVGLALSAGAFVPGGAFFSPHAPVPTGAQYGWNSTNRTTYPVNFNESGLPAGVFWSVALHGSWNGGFGPGQVGVLGRGSWWPGWNGSNGSTVGFNLANGTYNYSIGDARNGSSIYVASPSSGNLTVNGTGVNVSVSFSPITLSSVSFVETGLPSSTNWTVGVRSTPSWGGWGSSWSDCGSWGGWGRSTFAWNTSDSSTVDFSLPNGGYDFWVGAVRSAGDLYLPTPSTGNVTVNGSAVTVSVSFEAIPLTDVTFNETGLPNGTVWGAAVFNWSSREFVSGDSNTSSLTLAVSNGTYDFAIGPVWNSSGIFVATPHYGNVTVDGTTVFVDVQFTFQTSYWQVAAPPN